MIPFSPPRIDEEIIAEVIATLKSGWITTGPRTKLFEKEITKYTNCVSTLCLNSATAGLELMLRWFGVGKGDEVIVPAYTYCATANVVIHCGATPVMADVDNETFNISIEDIKKKITKRTKAIIPVDIAGFPCDYNSINMLVSSPAVQNLFSPTNDIQKQLGHILVLADAAHSFGAIYNSKTSGSFTDLSVFSFHAVKNLTTAEGGAIALNLPPPFDNEELYKFLCVLSLHGQNKDALAKTTGNWKYDIITAGYKSNMTDIQAAIGLIELKRYKDDTLKKRKYIFDYYSSKFNQDNRFIVPLYENKIATSSYHAYLLRIKDIDENTRDHIIQKIFEKGVSVNVHFQPLPLFSFYKSLGYKISDYPQSYNNYKCEISLPVYYDLDDEKLEIIVNSVISSLNEIK